MSLDVRICARKPIFCPDCGKIVYYVDLDNELRTGGHCLRDVLRQLNYGDNEYATWQTITPDQATLFAKTCKREKRYNADNIEQLVAYAVFKGYPLFIYANW